MNNTEKIECIVHGMELYFRAFALADNIGLHAEDIEWIAPEPGANGPALVYRVSLEEQSARTRLESLLPEIKAGTIPSFWVISPTSTPSNIVDCLASMGFRDLSNAEHPEPGMALEVEAFSPGTRTNLTTEVRKVTSLDEFAVWIDIVNEALHGGALLSVEIVTLRSHADAIPLYAGLGFKPYYEQILLSYPQ